MAMLLKLQEAANYIESPEKEADPKLPTLWTQIYTEPSRIFHLFTGSDETQMF